MVTWRIFKAGYRKGPMMTTGLGSVQQDREQQRGYPEPTNTKNPKGKKEKEEAKNNPHQRTARWFSR